MRTLHRDLLFVVFAANVAAGILTAADPVDSARLVSHKQTGSNTQLTPLRLAVIAPDLSAVKRLLAQGANPNDRAIDTFGPGEHRPKYRGVTILMRAVYAGNSDIAAELLRYHADPNIRTEGGEHLTALIIAASRGYPRIVATLLANGANPNLKGGGGIAPIHELASWQGRLNDHDINIQLRIAETLIKAGANVNVQDDTRETALIQATRFGRAELVNFLLANGADPNHVSRSGTALKWARLYNDAEIARLLITAGAKR
jgi:ankyrin repeat protein